MGTIRAVTDADVILKSSIGFINQIEHAESQAEQAEASSSQAEKQFQATLKTEKFTSVKEARSAYLDDDAPPVKINPGDRIAQAMLVPVPRCEFEVCEQLTLTERGDGGFGSTGTD
jgi:hypothetical protein